MHPAAALRPRPNRSLRAHRRSGLSRQGRDVQQLVRKSDRSAGTMLIDPNRTAFAELKGSPYLHGPHGLIYPPEDSALDTLDSLIEEMEHRYKLFEQNLVSDLPEYQAKTIKSLPRIVCVCDEYAALVADRVATKNVEAAITRLGARARAAGIHLIIATQNPDRKTVGGALKMNLGGRICLRVANFQQSNMIINQSGAREAARKGRPLLSEHWRSCATASALFVPGGSISHFRPGVVIGWARVGRGIGFQDNCETPA